MHERVRGTTPEGVPYHANDPELLRWVQATAAFGFVEAYHAYVRPLPPAEKDRYYAEGAPAARLYGAEEIPLGDDAIRRLFDAMLPRLQPSPVVFEFLDIMERAAILPAPLRPFQHMLMRAAVDLTPPPVRAVLGLDRRHGLRGWEAGPVRLAGAMADRLVVQTSPAVQACLRLGLPADHLYRPAAAAGPGGRAPLR
jgi:uncharacterized protein (DUF2236 family)